MEVKINKEIREYTENIFFGLSLRQFIFSVLACGVAVLLYFLFRDKLGLEATSWICIIGAIPFGALGFIKYNGMTADEFVVAWVKSEILLPKVLHFKPENIYAELLKDEYKRLEKEEMKIENNNKKGKRKSKNSKKCAKNNTNKDNI